MATTEVADHLLAVDFVEEANVYGVKVPGNNEQDYCDVCLINITNIFFPEF